MRLIRAQVLAEAQLDVLVGDYGQPRLCAEERLVRARLAQAQDLVKVRLDVLVGLVSRGLML